MRQCNHICPQREGIDIFIIDAVCGVQSDDGEEKGPGAEGAGGEGGYLDGGEGGGAGVDAAG